MKTSHLINVCTFRVAMHVYFLKLTSFYISTYVCIDRCVTQCACGGQRVTLGSQFPPASVESGIELRSSGKHA